MPRRQPKLSRLPVCLLAGVLSCVDEAHPPTWSGGADEGATSEPGLPGTSTSGEGGTSSGSESSSDGGTVPKLDLHAIPDAAIHDECQSVDFLFVIDSTGSMAPHQQQLIDSFDGFVSGISAHFGPLTDFHIGVISTDTYAFNAPPCRQFGALVTEVISDDATPIVCTPYAEGNRYMTELDDLEVAFPCTANLGPGGDTVERPVTSAIEALGPTLNAPGACNEGFSRENALLVIVMITNSMTGDVPGADADPNVDPTPWHQAVVDLKGGHPENVVVIGFVADGDTWCIPNGYDGYQAPNLVHFIESFGDNGVVANVCLPEYATIFQDSIDVVLEACDGFIPPG